MAPDEPQISLVVMQSVPATRLSRPCALFFETVERVIAAFPLSEQPIIPGTCEKFPLHRFARAFFPLKSGRGHVPAVEILKSTVRTRECVESRRSWGKDG